MKIVTANRLADGAVVYLSENATWTENIARARRLGDEADDALADALERVTEIASAYLVDIGPDGAPTGREARRENIRRRGPTVRPDLAREETTS